MKIGNLDIDKSPRICISIPIGLSNKINDDIKYADLIEARIDYSKNKNVGFIKEELEKLSKYNKPIIITNRKKYEGGAFDGTDEERIEIMESLMNSADCIDCIDIELSTESRIAGRLILHARSMGIKTIISHHDFNRTPSDEDIRNIINRELDFGDIAKIAFKINDAEDILRIYGISLEISNDRSKPIISIPMGHPIARIAGILFRSQILYAGNIAPGQLSARNIRDILDVCNM